MNEYKLQHIDVFSERPNKGNPAAVMLEANHYSTEEMQAVAATVGFNETVFVLSPRKNGNIRLRFFSPGSEMALCGHGTLAAAYALWKEKKLPVSEEIVIETLAGIITVKAKEDDQTLFMEMAQNKPEFEKCYEKKEVICELLGIASHQLDERLPIIYGSTGVWTLIVPVKKLSDCYQMVPQNKNFASCLSTHPTASVHPICLETVHQEATMHGRHFSGAFSGTVEDPVTGTASGVMGAYYKQFIQPELPLPATILVEQGQEMGKDGMVQVFLIEKDEKVHVSIAGRAIYVSEIVVKLEINK